jgi:hypothetical protein
MSTIEGLEQKVESLREGGGWVYMEGSKIVEDDLLEVLLASLPNPPEAMRTKLITIMWVPPHTKRTDDA